MQITLLPHLIWKDLRHVRLLFGLWLFLLLAQGALIGSGFSAGPGNLVWQMAYTILSVGIPLLQALVIIILLPILIQEEPLVGSTAFWFTRPISRGTVLAAKVVFVAGFLIIPPLVVEILVFVANGIETRDILRALPEVLYGSIALIVPIAALSALTRSFAKFALWLVVIWVSMTMLVLMVQFGRMILSMDSVMADSQKVSLALSRGIVAGLCGITGGAIVIGVQYLTRKTRVSLIILIITYGVSMAVQFLWQHDFFRQPEPTASPATFPDGTVIISLKPESVWSSDAIQFAIGREPRTDIRTPLVFSHVPAGYQIEIAGTNSKLTFAGGITLTSQKSTPPLAMMEQWWPDALAHAIGDIPVVNSPATNGQIFGQVFDLDTATYQQRKLEPGTLQATFSLNAKKLEVLGRLPLREGSRLDIGSRHIEITSVLKQTAGCRLILRERKVNLWSSRSYQQFAPLAASGGVYLLVNRQRNQSILPVKNLYFDMASTFLQASSRLINRSFVLDFNGALHDKEVVGVDADWLAGAELVLVEARPAGTLQREVTISNFMFNKKK